MTLYLKSMSRPSQRPLMSNCWVFREFKLIFLRYESTRAKVCDVLRRRFGNIVSLLSTEISFWSISLQTRNLTTVDLQTLCFGGIILESDGVISGHEGNLFTESLGHLVGWFTSSVSKSFKTRLMVEIKSTKTILVLYLMRQHTLSLNKTSWIFFFFSLLGSLRPNWAKANTICNTWGKRLAFMLCLKTFTVACLCAKSRVSKIYKHCFIISGLKNNILHYCIFRF